MFFRYNVLSKDDLYISYFFILREDSFFMSRFCSSDKSFINGEPKEFVFVGWEECFGVQVGIKQGCVVFPRLFNLSMDGERGEYKGEGTRDKIAKCRIQRKEGKPVAFYV